APSTGKAGWSLPLNAHIRSLVTFRGARVAPSTGYAGWSLPFNALFRSLVTNREDRDETI
ncbi:MAG: hypothetical protein ACE5HN_09150, partial [Nitrospiria bacterium]